MKGLPYSGKTTWAREQCGRKRDVVRVSWTEIRSMMSAKEYDRQITHTAVYTALRLIERALKEGKTVILDELNLYGPSFSLFLGVAQMCKARTEFHLVKCSAEECKRRCSLAGGSTAELMKIDMLADKYALVLKK